MLNKINANKSSTFGWLWQGTVSVLFCVGIIAATAIGAEQSNNMPVSSIGFGERMNKLISANFSQTPIDDVIRQFADQGEIDIVKGNDVTGEVTALFTDVPLHEALKNILAVNGYGYIETGNMIRIMPEEKIASQKLDIISKVYRITYADIEQVGAALEKFISEDGKISSNVGTSNIIVSDAEERIRAIDTFIEEVDRITPQVLVEARIYDISGTDQLDLGVEWYAGRTSTFDSDTGKVTGGRTEPFVLGQFDSTISKVTKTASGMLRFGMFNDSIDIDAVLSAKQDTISAKLLASPRILVLDNETANIKIVSELPYQELTQTSEGGSIGTTSFKEVGVELEVTPHITRDDMIRLKICPKFSVQVDSVSIAIPVGNSSIIFPQPVVDSREASTTALIQDGQIVVIGGLRKKDSIIEESKVPLLGDIPLLGALFKFKGEKTVNSELVVFISSTIVIEPKMTSQEIQQLEATERNICPLEFPKTDTDRCTQ